MNTDCQPLQSDRRRLISTCAWCAMGLGWGGAWAKEGVEGVEVGGKSQFTKLVDAAELERNAANQYRQLLKQAADKKALASSNHPQLQRLRRIGDRLIPNTLSWNERASDWRWEINLLGSMQINAFCMPGGKIAFFYGILKTLELTDDEIAMVMGHEMAHALREHSRERIGKQVATTGLAKLGGVALSAIFGIDPNITGFIADQSANLLALKFSREDESEADLVGMDMAARSGFDPRAGVSLWKKMTAANQTNQPQWLSTHPSGDARIQKIEQNLDKVLPLYQRSRPG